MQSWTDLMIVFAMGTTRCNGIVPFLFTVIHEKQATILELHKYHRGSKRYFLTVRT